MIYLSDVRDFIDSLHFSEHVYSGKLDNKPEESIGVYNNKTGTPPQKSVSSASYSVKRISLLVHWNESQRETERKAYEIYEAVKAVRMAAVNNTKILFTEMETDEPVDVSTDDNGIYEMVINFKLYYERQV
ncbi:MAG: minor capsid protein [Eubacteriales bacterium]|nr:minor capsid protein [Eubacteriales bacterium]